jgi:hypothetical protein
VGGTFGTHGEGRVYKRFLFGGPKLRDHWEDLGIGGKITLSWTLWKYGSIGQTGFGWLRIGSSRGISLTR